MKTSLPNIVASQVITVHDSLSFDRSHPIWHCAIWQLFFAFDVHKDLHRRSAYRKQVDRGGIPGSSPSENVQVQASQGRRGRRERGIAFEQHTQKKKMPLQVSAPIQIRGNEEKPVEDRSAAAARARRPANNRDNGSANDVGRVWRIHSTF